MSLKGKNVKCHYRGTLDDGTQFDSSYDRGEPLAFVCGAGQMIKGFDAAVENMEVGQVVKVRLAPEEAYGQVNENLILSFPKDSAPDADQLQEGMQIFLQDNMGNPIPARIKEITDDAIVVDANHELAGCHLTFEIELVEVLD